MGSTMPQYGSAWLRNEVLLPEQITELKQRLVVSRKQDGRCCYDPQAKRELIEAYLQPGVSVAKLALAHGINANLLRT